MLTLDAGCGNKYKGDAGYNIAIPTNKPKLKQVRRERFLTSKVIIFSGIDGSGKSTHARIFGHRLKSNGLSVKYVYMRGLGRIFISLPFLALCRLLKITKVHRLKGGIRVSEYRFYAYKPLRLLWPLIQLVDSMIYTLILILLSQHFYDVIIFDRSSIDTLVDIIADTRLPIETGILQKLFLSLLPRNSIVIILDINEEIALTRKRDILGKSYLSVRRRIYLKLAELYHWHVISTNGSFETSIHSIESIISRM